MNIIALIKGVPDTESVLELSADGLKVNTDNLTFIMNPYDEYALEEAILIRDRVGGELTAVSVGGEEAVKVLRSALALGVDRALIIDPPDGSELSELGTSRLLAAALAARQPDLILAGRQSVDTEGSQVSERVAALLDFPHLASVFRIELEESRLKAECETSGGSVTIGVDLPAVVAVQKGINEPRYPALPAVMKARKLPIEEFTPGEDDLDAAALSPKLSVIEVEPFRKERKKMILDGTAGQAADELAGILVSREKVL
jgi:electron transfer flavoprotein beta subunit